MELVIQTPEFTVKVDTDRKDFKVGDILCMRTIGLLNYRKKDGSYSIPPEWCLFKIKTELSAKFHKLISNTYKVVEIYE